MRAVLTTAAVKDWKLRHVDVEQACLQAEIDKDMHVEIAEDYRAFPNALGMLRKAIYGLVHQACAGSEISPTASKIRD